MGGVSNGWTQIYCRSKKTKLWFMLQSLLHLQAGALIISFISLPITPQSSSVLFLSVLLWNGSWMTFILCLNARANHGSDFIFNFMPNHNGLRVSWYRIGICLLQWQRPNIWVANWCVGLIASLRISEIYPELIRLSSHGTAKQWVIEQVQIWRHTDYPVSPAIEYKAFCFFFRVPPSHFKRLAWQKDGEFFLAKNLGSED